MISFANRLVRFQMNSIKSSLSFVFLFLLDFVSFFVQLYSIVLNASAISRVKTFRVVSNRFYSLTIYCASLFGFITSDTRFQALSKWLNMIPHFSQTSIVSQSFGCNISFLLFGSTNFSAGGTHRTS